MRVVNKRHPVFDRWNLRLGRSFDILVTAILILALAGRVVAGEAAVGTDLSLAEMVEQFPGLTESQCITLRDAVAYQISMGRSLETTIGQLAGASLQIGVPQKMSSEIIAGIYESLTRPPQPPVNRPRAVALIGDRYHHPGYIRPALERACRQAEVDVRFVYDVRLLTRELVADYDILIILRDGMLWPTPGENDPFGKERVFWLTEDQERAIAEFVGGGGGYLAIHNATALKALDGRASLYHEVLGASYAGHGPERETYAVVVTRPTHPVAATVSQYQVNDERHWPRLHVSDVEIFLEAVSGEQRSVHGFTRLYQKGRICYLANGHNRETLELAAVQEMLVKALRWCDPTAQK